MEPRKELKALWIRADSRRGCLYQLRCHEGRRRSADDTEDPFKMDTDWLVQRNHFVADTAKLLSSKALRRMRHKTQVLTDPENPFIRDRRSHVDEVVATSVILADMLGLNTHLVEAIAWGHDIGHVPFGHPGEHWMAKAMGRPEFCHEIMGPVIAQKIERRGRGLNLTFETLEGMMRHSGAKAREGMTQEAWVVRYADKFAYIFHDYNDIVGRMNYPAPVELVSLMDVFGRNQRERATTAMSGLIVESAMVGKVSFEQSELAKQFTELRGLMYKIYPRVTRQDVGTTLEPILKFLETLGIADPFLLLALMTDRDVSVLNEKQNIDIQAFNRTSVAEMVPYLQDIGEVDLCNSHLDW